MHELDSCKRYRLRLLIATATSDSFGKAGVKRGLAMFRPELAKALIRVDVHPAERRQADDER